MSNRKTILSALLVMLLWGTLFPMVKLGYSAYNIVTAGDILYFAGARFTVCGAVICIYTLITDKGSYKAVKTAVVPVLLSGVFAIILHCNIQHNKQKGFCRGKACYINRCVTAVWRGSTAHNRQTCRWKYELWKGQFCPGDDIYEPHQSQATAYGTPRLRTDNCQNCLSSNLQSLCLLAFWEHYF